MIHAAFTEIKSSSLGLVADLDIIVILKSLWQDLVSYLVWANRRFPKSP
jgi:hypothetical protein